MVTASDCPYCMLAANGANPVIMNHLEDITIWIVSKKLHSFGDCDIINLLKGQYPFLYAASLSFVNSNWTDATLGRSHYGSVQASYYTKPDMGSVYRIINPKTKKATSLGFYLPNEIDLINSINDNLDLASNITLSGKTFYYQPQTSVMSITVTSKVAWAIKNNTPRLSFSQTSGSGNMIVNASVTSNLVAATRNSYFTINVVGNKEIFKVSQSGSSPILTLFANNLTFNQYDSSTLVTKSGNTNWAIDNRYDWITIDKNSGVDLSKFTIRPSINEMVFERNAVISVSGNRLTRKIQINQTGEEEYLQFEEGSVTIAGNVNSKNLIFCNNTSWTITGAPDWLVIDPLMGTGNITVILTPTKNSGKFSRLLYIRASLKTQLFVLKAPFLFPRRGNDLRKSSF